MEVVPTWIDATKLEDASLACSFIRPAMHPEFLGKMMQFVEWVPPAPAQLLPCMCSLSEGGDDGRGGDGVVNGMTAARTGS